MKLNIRENTSEYHKYEISGIKYDLDKTTSEPMELEVYGDRPIVDAFSKADAEEWYTQYFYDACLSCGSVPDEIDSDNHTVTIEDDEGNFEYSFYATEIK